MSQLTLPCMDVLVKNLTEEQIEIAENCWNALWAVYVRNKGTTSGVYWAEQFADPRAFNVFLMVLKDYIKSSAIPSRNWATLELNPDMLAKYYSEKDLVNMRAAKKYSQYIPRIKNSVKAGLVKQHGKVKETGLERKGFALSSNTQYFYDVNKLIKYEKGIKSNVIKGMSKLRETMPNLSVDDASYDTVSAGIVDLLKTPELFTQGLSYIDSRGRAIKESLKYIGNPIGYKDFRSLISVPEGTDKDRKVPVVNQVMLDAVYLFIAELLGYKRGTVSEKLAYGIESYKNRTLPDADKDLAERIWLERHYEELSRLYKHKELNGSYVGYHYNVPIELDASASMLGLMGALLGSKSLLEMCNMTGPEEQLNDPWYIEGLGREHVKKAATPKLYGSSQSVVSLWNKNGLEYTTEQLATMNQMFNKGAIGLADRFKEFVLNNCNPQEKMNIVIGKDKFSIDCSRWKKIGDVPMSFDIYDTETGGIRRITHMKTKMIPDLERFRTYFQTLLIHNLDGQIADAVSGKVYAKYGFCLDIHDAFVVPIWAVEDVRKWYTREVDEIYKNRFEILKGFFESIGIVNFAGWNKLVKEVEPVVDFKCRTQVLK